MNRERERGVAMVLAAFWLILIFAIGAIAVEVSRLTDTATEVQVAADAAALAAAQNMLNTGTTSSATTAAQTVAGQNSADGRHPAASDVSVVFGNYTVGGGFVAGGAPNNAVRATVTMSNVRYLMATVLGAASSTSVTKRAVATFTCTQAGQPTAPLVLGDCELQTFTQGQRCSSTSGSIHVHPDPNSCWVETSIGSNEAWFPTGCPAGSGQAPLLAVGQTWNNSNNGTKVPLFRDFQDCLDAGINKFIIPVAHCPFPSSCKPVTIVGFATITVTSVNVHGSHSTIDFQQVCDNNAPGTGGNSSGGGGACFGSGNARLVDDR